MILYTYMDISIQVYIAGIIILADFIGIIYLNKYIAK